MLYNFLADSFHTKKLCSRLSLNEVRFYTEIGPFAFLSPFKKEAGHRGNVRAQETCPVAASIVQVLFLLCLHEISKLKQVWLFLNVGLLYYFSYCMTYFRAPISSIVSGV